MADPTLNSATTQGVRVSVKALFVPEQSAARNHSFVFAYRISILNEGETSIQLLRRHWDITDGYAEARVVEGEGVVGQQPILEPGQEHSYVSGCVLRSQLGRMEGYYTMQRLATGSAFEVRIPPFLLIAPFLLN